MCSHQANERLEEGSVSLHFCFLQAQEVPHAPGRQACLILALNLQMSSRRMLLWRRCQAHSIPNTELGFHISTRGWSRTSPHLASISLLPFLFHAPSASTNRCPRPLWLQSAKTFGAAILFQDGKEIYKVNLTRILPLFKDTPDLVMRGEKSIPPNVTRKQNRKG